MGRELEIPLHVAESAEEALADADMIITATNSRTPVFDGEQLKAGMHITSIANGDKTRTRQELDDRGPVPGRADISLPPKRRSASTKAIFSAPCAIKVIAWDNVHEMSSLLLGQVAGRSDDRQITLFKLQGTGIMDVAIGAQAYERLKA